MYRKGMPLPGFSTTAVTVLSLFLVVAGVLTIALIPAEFILFRPAAYLRALDNQRFYDRFPEMLAGSILSEPDPLAFPGLGSGAVEYLDPEDAARMIAPLMPAEWTRARAEILLTNLGEFLNFERSDLSLPLDLRELKARLSGDAGAAAARELVRSWPPCSAEDAAAIAAQALRGELQGLPVCRPPDALIPVFESAVQVALAGASALLPDQLELAQPVTADGSEQGLRGPLVPQFWSLFRWYSWLRWLFRLTPVLALSFLIWITLLAARSLPYWFHSLGQPLLQTGLISVFLSAAMLLFGNRILSGLVVRALPLLPASFEPALAPVLSEVWSRASFWSLYLSLSVIAVAVIFLILDRALAFPD